jgi:hypothetical protein
MQFESDMKQFRNCENEEPEAYEVKPDSHTPSFVKKNNKESGLQHRINNELQ